MTNTTELENAVERGVIKAQKRQASGLTPAEEAEVALLKSVTGGLSPKDWTTTEPTPVDQN